MAMVSPSDSFSISPVTHSPERPTRSSIALWPRSQQLVDGKGYMAFKDCGAFALPTLMPRPEGLLELTAESLAKEPQFDPLSRGGLTMSRFMSHGVADSQEESLEINGSGLQHERNKGGHL